MPDPKNLIRTRALDWSKALHGRHPYNPKSEMRGVPMADLAGLKRSPVHLLKVPPGKESFVPHAHSVQEEWVFVVEGTGVVSLDREDHPIGPGDFVGFPTDGTVHQMRNTGTIDLVYLTGGERTRVEVADMPSLGKIAVVKDNAVTFYDKAASEHVSMEDWNKRSAIKTD